MNKYQIAYNYLLKRLGFLICENISELITIRKLVEKTAPIKHDNIVEYDEIFDEYTVGCGICNKHIYCHYKFCPHCGQAIDWRCNK